LNEIVIVFMNKSLSGIDVNFFLNIFDTICRWHSYIFWK